MRSAHVIGQEIDVTTVMVLDTSRRTARCEDELHQKSLVDATLELDRRLSQREWQHWLPLMIQTWISVARGNRREWWSYVVPCKKLRWKSLCLKRWRLCESSRQPIGRNVQILVQPCLPV